MFKSAKFKKFTASVMTAFMLLGFVAPDKALAADGDVANIEILATSDFHGKFMPWDYATNKEDKTGSLTQLTTIIKGLRQSNPNSILVDAGDTIQGNSSELFLKDQLHPMMLAMNEMGYETWSMGNHEFNYGVPTLKTIMNEFKNTALCANVYEKDGVTRLNSNPGYKIVERSLSNGDKVKVGIIGMVTPNILKWDSKNLEGYKVTSPIDEAKKLVPEIQKQTDIIIAVVHMSENNEYDVAGSGTIDLANAVPELTAIVAAHEHKAMDGTLHNNILTTENKNGAATIAKMDLKVVKKDGKYVVANKSTDVTSKLIWAQDQVDKTKFVDPDTDLTSKLQSYHDRAKADAETVIGELKGGDLVPPNEINGIPTAQVQDTAMIDLINKVQMHYTGADISSTAMFVSSANIKEGQIQKAGTALIYPYANTLYKVEITGKQLKKYMEWSANYYNTFKPGDLTISFNQNVRAYNYDMFSGVKYEVNVSKDAGSRIENLRKMDDTPIKDDDVFTMAVNNYRANSHLAAGGEIFKDGDAPKILAIDVKGELGGVRELIADYIKNVNGGVITPEVDNNWKIVGNNWDAKQRALAVKLINSGKLQLPKSADGRTPNVASITYSQALAANKVDVVSFNDFHGSLKEDTKNIGAAKLTGEIAKYKKANPDTIVVSGGDNYQGSAMSNLKHGAPVSEMMKAMGVQASAVGNHEFDWGSDYIAQWAQEGGFNFLAANIYSKATNNPVAWAKPYQVISKGGLKIGFVGIATPDTVITTKAENIGNLEFRDPVATANEWAAKLKNGSLPEGKVDVVIALTHLGAMQDATTGKITGEAADFANGVKNVDAIISAHTHQVVNGTVNNIPIVQAYYNGRALGDLSLMMDADGKFTSVKSNVAKDLYKKTDLVEDPTVKAIYAKYEKELAPILNEVVGSTDKDLTHDKAQPGVSTLGQWISDVMKEKAGTQIAITNGGGVRIPLIAKGDITMGKMYELMPFDNTLVKMELKGSDLKRVLEGGIGNPLGWGQFTGVKVYYDINADFGKRITAMYLNDGTKVDMDKYYTLVTNDFMYNPANPAKGGDNYDFTGAKNVVNTGTPIREALVEQLRTLKAAGKSLSVTPVQYAIAGVDPSTATQAITNDTAKVVEAINKAADKSTVVVDATSNPVASKDIFTAIKGRDVNVTFQRDGITWTFNGKDIDPTLIKDIDLSLKTVSAELKAKEAAKVKSIVGKDVAIVPFSFTYDGKLPGKATVKVFIGKDWANTAVYVNRYYADKNTYEIVQEATVDADGYMTFTTDHCSDYFVMAKSAAPNLPKTGSPIDMNVVVGMGSLVALLGAALFISGRKREENDIAA